MQAYLLVASLIATIIGYISVMKVEREAFTARDTSKCNSDVLCTVLLGLFAYQLLMVVSLVRVGTEANTGMVEALVLYSSLSVLLGIICLKVEDFYLSSILKRKLVTDSTSLILISVAAFV
jgi:hypothetical protein